MFDRRIVPVGQLDHLVGGAEIGNQLKSVIEFLRTAQRPTRLRADSLRRHATSDAAFIDACEDAISVENQACLTALAASNRLSMGSTQAIVRDTRHLPRCCPVACRRPCSTKVEAGLEP
jgi:hypothetical protein